MTNALWVLIKNFIWLTLRYMLFTLSTKSTDSNWEITKEELVKDIKFQISVL